MGVPTVNGHGYTNVGAVVGMHLYINLPHGTKFDRLDGPVRPLFFALYKNELMTRTDAYSSLAEHLGIDTSECHFALFDIDMCHKAERATQEILKEID